jgi:hypothetical protein
MEAQGAAWPPDEPPHYERTVQSARSALGDEAFTHAYAFGSSMTTDVAVDLALATDGHALLTRSEASGS